jgi:corrinoid protein of di/trimethylamine methyltransferase
MATKANDCGFHERAKEAIITLNKVDAFKIAEQASSEMSASDLVALIEEGYRAGMVVVGDKFGRGEMFLPELVAAAEAMKSSLEIMQPKLREGKITQEPVGRIVLATVKSDLHDIGKTMVASLLTARGFEVIDLGVDVDPLDIIDTAEKSEADIIGLSALLTTTIEGQKDVIESLKEKGRREKFKIMIGGAASSRLWAEEIGADAYGADAQEAVSIAEDLVNLTRTGRNQTESHSPIS